MEDVPITKQRCPSCTKTKMILDNNTGELFCSFCGFVMPEKLIEGGPEWRSFSNDGTDRSRVGAGTSIQYTIWVFQLSLDNKIRIQPVNH